MSAWMKSARHAWAAAALLSGGLGAAMPAVAQSATPQGTGAEGHAPAGLLAQKWGFVDKYCSKCHNSTDWAGGMAFDTIDKDDVGTDAKVWEEAERRLRGHLMQPPGEQQP